MTPDEELIIQVQCPDCQLWFDHDNDRDNGLIRHALAEHPFGRLAGQIDTILLETILEKETP